MKTFYEVKAEVAGKIVAVPRRERGCRSWPASRSPRSRLSLSTPMAIRTLLIANRGEIAVRIIRAAHELGIRTVQVAQPGRREIAGGRAGRRGGRDRPAAGGEVLSEHRCDPRCRASAAGADAVHPGYGFLAENAAFADAVEQAGLIFVGPRARDDPPDGRQGRGARGGDERPACRRCPGSDGPRRRSGAARAVVERIGFPGDDQGGGRRRRARHPRRPRHRRVRAPVPAGERRGAGRLRRRRPLSRAADRARAPHRGAGARRRRATSIHCFERECSLQRRRQKVWEEAPSPALARRRAREALRLRRGARARRSAIAAPARSNISTTTRPASSSSSR